MKKLLFSLFALCLANLAFAQTNTFPTTGNVGIGTLSPNDILHVYAPTANTRLRLGNNAGYDQLLYFNGSADWSMGIDYSNSNAFSIAAYSSLAQNHRLTILNNGNVGIGTTSPSTLLHLKGAVNSNFLRIENATTSLSLGDNIGAIQFYSNDPTDFTAGVAASIHATAGPSGGEGRLEFRTQMPSEGADPTTSMIITQTGRVGIGTTSPNAKLEVKGDFLRLQESAAGRTLDIYPSISGQTHRFTSGTTVAGYSFENNIGTLMTIASSGNVGIGTTSPDQLFHVAGTSGNHRIAIGETGTGRKVLYAGYNFNSDAGELQAVDEGTAYKNLLLNPTGGNVGIGTSSPTEKLSVDGTVLAKKVRVSTAGVDWPDFVFAPSYELRALSEVESFVKENKHLPEVPSAKEVEKEGLDLGKMDATLLKKVEELTLYLIEEHKSSKQRAASLKEMQEKLLKLEAQNSKLQKEIQELKKNK